MKKPLLILLPLSLALLPVDASAQLDALIDVVVDAVEPTPVYDTGLREATENLASKIDRLNHVLFGGAEETSAAYRYMTMYSDLYELTSAFTAYVDRTYTNARRLEAMYRSLGGQSSLHDYAYAVEGTWHSYDAAVRQGSAIVARFKTLFSDPNVTNGEVRQAAREAIATLETLGAAEQERIEGELAVSELAAGLVECSAIMESSPKDYIEEGRKTYGTAITSGEGGSTMGVLGTAVMVIIGLLTVIYGMFTAVHFMKGSASAEQLITRLIFFFIFAIIMILSIQVFI